MTQPKILRVLQEGEFERVGGTRTIRVDVRIVTATNQDLAALVREKRFREDLFYRLNVITIRCRRCATAARTSRVLAQHFLRVYAAKNNRAARRLHATRRSAASRPTAWPGNVRELENVVERAVVLARGARVEAAESARQRRRAIGDDGARRRGRRAAEARRGAAREGVFKIRWARRSPRWRRACSRRRCA